MWETVIRGEFSGSLFSISREIRKHVSRKISVSSFRTSVMLFSWVNSYLSLPLTLTYLTYVYVFGWRPWEIWNADSAVTLYSQQTTVKVFYVLVQWFRSNSEHEDWKGWSNPYIQNFGGETSCKPWRSLVGKIMINLQEVGSAVWTEERLRFSCVGFSVSSSRELGSKVTNASEYKPSFSFRKLGYQFYIELQSVNFRRERKEWLVTFCFCLASMCLCYGEEELFPYFLNLHINSQSAGNK
jgi:hypothetical protein